MQVNAYKVTIQTPSGEQVIECGEDTYILYAAEVRDNHLLRKPFKSHLTPPYPHHIAFKYLNTFVRLIVFPDTGYTSWKTSIPLTPSSDARSARSRHLPICGVPATFAPK